MSDTAKSVLVTRDRIDSEAVAMLDKSGFECIFLPPQTPSPEVARIAKEAQVKAIMVSQGRITDEVIGASDALEVIVKHGSGVNNINLTAAERRNIPVYRAIGANAEAVAEHAIALLLALRKSLPLLDTATKEGRWLKGSFIGRDLKGTRLGLIGLGMIGREVARMAASLGMEVMAYDPSLEQASPVASELGITICASLDELLEAADAVSLHCPLVPATHHLVDATFLRKMRPQAILVNTARGGMVDEEALAEALHSELIAGAGIDSFEQEPPDKTSKLWAAPNLIATPHAAGLTPGAERAMATTAARLIMDHCARRPIDRSYRAEAAVLGGLQE